MGILFTSRSPQIVTLCMVTVVFCCVHSGFYGRSGVCLALHITPDYPPGWEYSVFVFLGESISVVTIISILGHLLINIPTVHAPMDITYRASHN